MGYMKHDAIIVTTWKREAFEAALAKAYYLQLHVIGPSPHLTNDYATFLICPDGSKEGWQESKDFDVARVQFIEYLNSQRYVDGSSSLSWVALSYGGDDAEPSITGHTKQPEGTMSTSYLTAALYPIWREARLRFIRDNPATARSMNLQQPPESFDEYVKRRRE